MKEKPKKETHYGKKVWVNPTTEALRKSECLCLNCGNMKPNQPANCSIAESLFKISVNTNIAIAITRCPTWKPKT